MFKRFLFSRIGLSLIVALLIIGSATVLKMRSAKPDESIRTKIDLIAKESLKKAIENGKIDNPEWEKALKIATASSSVDEKIAELQKNAPSSEQEENLTATDKFTRTLLQRYVEIKNSGATLDENGTINLVNELLLKDYGGPEGEKTYIDSDITVLDTTSVADLKRYGNYLGSAIGKPVPDDYEHEVVLINKMYETGDASYLDKLPQNLARYTQMRREVESIAVPKIFQNAHIAVLNSLSAIIEGIRGMMLIDEDPIGATTLMLRYEDGFKSFDPALDIISNYFKTHNISFSSTEGGYLFLK